MSIMATLRRILNDTPGTATNIDYNFAVVEDYINTSVVTTDGQNSMSGTLVLSGPPSDPLHAASKGYVDSLWFTGMSVDYGGDVAPQGWVLENGALYSSTDPVYKPLFNVIGYRFGTDGQGNFRVPPAGRFVISRDTAVPAFDTVGKGVATGRDWELLSHHHVVPEHGHTSSGSTQGGGAVDHLHTAGGYTATGGGHSHPSGGGHTEVLFRDSAYNTGFAIPTVANSGGSGVAVTWGALAGGEHNQALTSTSGAADRDLNHNHPLTITVNNQVAFNTTDVGAGTTLTDKNLPPYVVMNRIMKL